MLSYVIFIDIWRVTEKIIERVGLLILLVIMCSVIHCTKILNEKTCETRENPLTFVVYEMECKFEGSQWYKYEGPSSVYLLSIDRLTIDSLLQIPTMTTLSKVVVENDINLKSFFS